MLAGAVRPLACVPHKVVRPGHCNRVSALTARYRPVISKKQKERTRSQPLIVAHSSLLLPDVSPESNVPPAMVQTIVEYARAMPTWEVLLRAGTEIAVSVALALLVVNIIRKATDKAIHVSFPSCCGTASAEQRGHHKVQCSLV